MIENIKNVNDLKKLTIEQKNILAKEIRSLILDTVSKNGGHLASNMGVVELTIALESILNMPDDKIIWDVGHQCYVHKILTSRYEDFKNIRKMGYIAGFPKTSESIYDTFNTGHSSTSISAALGIATANKLNNVNSKVVAVIGDRALTGGMAYEGLMNAGTSKANLLVILNDNEMSISKNRGGINKLLSKIRTKKHYVLTNNKIKQITSKIPYIGKPIINFCHNIKWSIKKSIIPNMFFEDIGFKYFGVVDGHDIEQLEQMIKLALSQTGPVLLHVKTIKGKGYDIAQNSPEKYHSTSPFDIKTGLPKTPKKTDFSKVFGDKLYELAKQNEKIIGITAAMKDGTGLSKFASEFPNRFIDATIAEQHTLTFCAGLAISGFIPVVNIYSSFYQRAYDQIIHDIAMQNLHVVMAIDRAGIVGQDGETHQGLLDLAMFRCVPNLTLMAPSSFLELDKMLEFSVNYNGPIMFRFPRGSQNELANYILDTRYEIQKDIEYGKCSILNKIKIQNEKSLLKNIKNMINPNKILIIAIGNKVNDSIIVEEFLSKIGIETKIINVRFLKPLDPIILDYIKKYQNIVTIEDGYIQGGLASAILELIALNGLNKNVLTIGYPQSFIEHGTVMQIEEKYKTDVKGIIEQILNKFKISTNEDISSFLEDLKNEQKNNQSKTKQ